MNKEILTEQRISADCNKAMRLRLFDALFFVAVAAVPVLLVIITPSPFSPELQVWFLRALSALAWAGCIAAVAVAVYKTTVAAVIIVRLLRKRIYRCDRQCEIGRYLQQVPLRLFRR